MDASALSNSISSTPHGFLAPSSELHLTSRLATKTFLDPLASSLTALQDARHKSQKNGRRDTKSRMRVRKLHLDGFSVDQVWEQVVRIIDETNEQLSTDILAAAKSLQKGEAGKRRLHPSKPAAADEDEASQSDSESHSDIDSDEASEDIEDMEDMEDDEGLEEDSEELENESNSDLEDKSSASDAPSETYVEDRFGLNDGFFSIDDFNKQSEYFEGLDAKGAQDDLSDGEEIDWHGNPEAAREYADQPSKSKKKSLDENEDEIEDSLASDNEEGFPDAGFGEDDSDEELEDAEDWIDTNDIKYDDFFAPPPRKASKNKSRPLPKTQPTQIPTEDDMERAISDVRRDLFEDFSDEAESDADAPNAAETEGARSTHEKQRAQIADEIRRLELANVTKKEWMLAGEAKAAQRPLNSLIENDLEFERVGKPVPVVTNETSDEIEQLIKRRILAKEFDEVIRRLPDSIRSSELNRGRVEVDQTKSQKSLAELYENDHLKSTDPAYVDQKDEKLKREHAEIAQLWKDTSSQLDLLSNWHYKPSVPQANINVITDVATVMMEDARPSGSTGVQATLAPQEVYHPKDATGFGGEVVLKNGVSVAKDEMSREEKSKRRRNEKKRSKSASQQPGKKAKTDEGQQILTDLKKGGVKMVGQTGELQSLDKGRKSGDPSAPQSDTLKL
jgi:U3 small nucleolar RNA-associated protein MPP10